MASAPNPWRDFAPWLALAGGLLVATGYGLLALANLQISALYRSGGAGDIAGAYQMGALGNLLAGVGLFVAIVGLVGLLRR